MDMHGKIENAISFKNYILVVPGTNTMSFSRWKRVAEDCKSMDSPDIFSLRMYLKLQYSA